MEKETIDVSSIKIDNSQLRLIYINPVGDSHDGSQLLEFIFSDNPDDAIGVGWEDLGIFGVQPPRKNYVKKVLEVTSKKIEFETIVESNEFRMLDAVFGIVGLAWQYIEDYTKLPSLNIDLLVFKYGDFYDDIISKLEKNNISYK
jgi:hypothetical protein